MKENIYNNFWQKVIAFGKLQPLWSAAPLPSSVRSKGIRLKENLIASLIISIGTTIGLRKISLFTAADNEYTVHCSPARRKETSSLPG